MSDRTPSDPRLHVRHTGRKGNGSGDVQFLPEELGDPIVHPSTPPKRHWIYSVTPSDWLKIFSFMITVFVGSVKLHTEFVTLREQATQAIATVAELHGEVTILATRIAAIEAGQAANTALLQRLADEQLAENIRARRKEIDQRGR